jgi:hypothetical protein
MYKGIAFALAAMVAGAAAAQSAAKPDPADPKARVPSVEYRSAFEGYRRYAEPEVTGWREMNQEVGRVGGHLGIVRGQGDAVKPGAKVPAEAGHGGHK